MATTEEQTILKLTLDYEDAVYGILRYKEKIQELKQAQKDMQDQVQAGTLSQEEYAKRLAASDVMIKQYSDDMRGFNKELQNNLKVEKANNEEREGSMVSLRAQLSNLTKEYDNLSKAQREGAKGKELAASINNITTEIKEAEAATQRYYRNVGNYENAIKSAMGEQSKFVRVLVTINDVTKDGVSGAFNTAKNAVAGFGKQLLTLLANPIVAVFGAIAAAIMLVVKGIKSSEENSNRLRVILAPLERVLNAILNVVQSLTGAILNIVSQGAALLGWLGNLAAKLPVVGKHFESVNQSLRDNIQLEKDRQALEKQSRQNTVQDAKDRERLSVLRKRAAAQQKTDTEAYLKTMKQVDFIEDNMAKRRVRQAEERYRVAKAEADQAHNTAETNDKLAQLEADVYNARAEYNERTMRDAGRVATAEKKLAAEHTAKGNAAKEAADKAAEAAKTELDAVRSAEDALTKLIRDNVERQRTEVNNSYDRRIEDLQRRLTEEKDLTVKARAAITAEIEAQEKLRAQDLAKIDEESNQAALERTEKRLALLLEATENDYLKQRELRLQQLDVQQQLDEQEIAQQVQNEQEREEMLEAVRASYRAQRADIERNFENNLIKQREDAIKQEFTDRINEAYGNEMEQERLRVQERLTLLEEAEQMEGETLEQFNSRKLQLQADYNAAKDALDKKELEAQVAKAQAIGNLMGSLGDVFGELGEKNKAFAVLQKTLALGEIAVNTGVALAQGIKQAQSVPFPANIAAIATTVATILANIATAIKTVNSAKFAEGGLIEGAGTGTSDSIVARVSNGESIMTANATGMFAPLLSSLNQLGGGVPIVAQPNPQQQLGEEYLAAAVARGMEMAPRPVVSVEEINSVGRRVEVIENIASV